MNLNFRYGTARVDDLTLVPGPVTRPGLPSVSRVELDGQSLNPSRRFLRSLFQRFHINEQVFRYYSYDEVLQRVREKAPCERFQYCVEEKKNSPDRLLAATPPDRPIARFGATRSLLQRYEGRRLTYSDGVITSTHTPVSGDGQFDIGTDKFKNRFVLQTPIDGCGRPKIHLALLRMVCSNGAVGYTPAFRTIINTGNQPLRGIERALETYDNDTGFAAMSQRFESAQNSWASLRETQSLYRLLVDITNRGGFTSDSVLKNFYTTSGRPHELYGIASLDSLSQKRQRVLPAKCRVYDLLNFASELATHKSEPESGLRLQAHIGHLLSDEFDMEGSAEKVTEFGDFLAN